MCFQTLILICLIVWTGVSPSLNLAVVIGAGLVIAICSASQDITIDALRIEQINEGDSTGMAAGAAVAVVGWWSGYKLGGLISLLAADWFQADGYENCQLMPAFVDSRNRNSPAHCRPKSSASASSRPDWLAVSSGNGGKFSCDNRCNPAL